MTFPHNSYISKCRAGGKTVQENPKKFVEGWQPMRDRRQSDGAEADQRRLADDNERLRREIEALRGA
jgi:hypothetical protein